MATVVPDGCVDIIINVGDDFYIESEDVVLKSEKAYLGGAITRCMSTKASPDTHLVGVRFKPGAFSHFYSFASLHEVTNIILEVENAFVPDLKSLANGLSSAFDSFFHNKLIQPKRTLLPVVDTVKNHHGNISVKKLADQHCTTVRQLERHFKYHIGLGPKEFTNIIRCKFAQHLVLTSDPKRTLDDIAFECGYYDLAHLSNEIKKYTGIAPTDL